MSIFSGWFARASVLRNDNAKGPWGSGGGNGDSGGGGDGGPRNPWQFPPEGKRGRGGNATSLEDFLKRTRGNGGGGGGFGGGGFEAPGGKKMWIFGALAVFAVFLAFTMIHRVGPQERGVVSSLGKYSSTLNPGIHLTLPAPFNTVRVIDVTGIRNEDFPQGGGENLVLTGDQNIVDLAYSMRWNIADPESYLFQIANPESTVRAVAESSMRAAVASVTLDEIIGAGRSATEVRVQQFAQQMLDEYNSGIQIQGVAIRTANPPAAVDEAFKAVTASQQAAQANLNQARAYAQQIIARSQGDAASFDQIYEQYRLAPAVTRQRIYYETMEEILAKSNKTIVETPGVIPYLPLPAVRGQQAQPAPQPQAATGAAQ